LDQLPPLSKTEWTIMNLCWRLKKATARQIHEASLVERKREYATVRTLLDRIAAKGYLAVERVGPVKVYRPKVGRRRAVGSAVDDFVDKVLERSLLPLYLHLSQRDDLSEEEIAFFRRQLEKKEEP
jgi:BlaI family transcriptional regulator, penicillinase repressor